MEITRLSFAQGEKISEVGYLKQTSVTETFQLHTHDFYEFFFIVQGKAIHNVNDENVLVLQGSLVFIRPNDIHKYSFFNDYDIIMISCGVERGLIDEACRYLHILPEYFLNMEWPPHVLLEGIEYWDMKKKLETISEKEPGKERKQYFLSILPQLLYLMTNKVVEKKSLPIWLTELLEDMNKQENFVEGLPAMLRIANKCQEHLTREFKKYLGITPTEFINMKRINCAAEMLLKRECEIIDTCHLCGFNNLAYFYRVFKQQLHCSPKQFIKKFE